MKWTLKNLVRVTATTLKPPQTNPVIEAPIKGMIERLFVITIAAY